MPVHIVWPGRLRVTVVESGTVEACWNASAFCRVKGGAAISWIVPDGTMVLAGQPVCQLDSFHLEEELASQSIIKSDGGIEWREVTLGRSNDRLTEVRQGIDTGERVLLIPLAYLR